MFLLYVLGVFAISLFGSQCEPQTREQVFECYSWGDPHVQTWRPKSGAQIQQRDCYVNGHHTLVKNRIVDFEVHVRQKLVDAINLKFHDSKTGKVIFHLHLKDFNKPTADEILRQQDRVTLTITTTGTRTTYTINNPANDILIVIREENARYYNIHTYMPQALADESTGLCALRDAACTLRGVATDELEWQPVRSGSTKQIFTNQQAESICNAHIDEFFAKIHRAPYQRDAHVNSTVTSVLAGCIDDVVLTGEIEMAQAGIDVLMMDELTRDATSIGAIQAAIESGIEQASSLLDDAAKMANVRVRRMI